MEENYAYSFVKMQGLGNDFVIFDAHDTEINLTTGMIRRIADRNRGVGCDQLVISGLPIRDDADVRVQMWNADGSPIAACGNASRCVGYLAMELTGKDEIVIETDSGLVTASYGDHDRDVRVDMGPARLDWHEIPLSKECDTLELPINIKGFGHPVGVNMGNPHAVFIVEDADEIDLEKFGPKIENNALFPERTNVELVTILGPERIRMRVWERGTGITQACGTGACAALVATHRRGLTERSGEVVLDGGTLRIEWREEDGHVLMTGPVARSFEGVLSEDLFAPDFMDIEA